MRFPILRSTLSAALAATSLGAWSPRFHEAQTELALGLIPKRMALYMRSHAEALRKGARGISNDQVPNVEDVEASFRRIIEMSENHRSSDAIVRELGVLAHQVEDERLTAVPFGEFPVVIFTSKLHRFALRESISIKELEGERMIMRERGSSTRRALETALQQAGVKPTVVMEIGHREIIREAVAQGIGIGAVSEVAYEAGPDLHRVRIHDADVRTYAQFIFLSERRESRMVRAFLDTLEQSRA